MWFARPEHAALAIIAAFTAMRLALAAALGLGVDEAYTLSVAHTLDLSYYDHPPLQYWIAHLFMPLLGAGRAARLPFIALFAGSGWLLYRLTQVLFDVRAALIALLALNCSAFFTYAGGWVLPDGPLMLALLAAALALARYFFGPPAGSPDPCPPRARVRWWLAAGFWLGIAALSKYHALLFAAGVLIFLASVPSRRRELRHAGPWLGVCIALAMSTPVILWNARHHWISILYQAGRAHSGGGSLHPELVLANILGQALWMLPWIFVPLLLAAWQAWRHGPASERSWYCLCLALPAIALFTVTPLWGRLGLPHWQMPGWLMLYPVLGDYAARRVPPLRIRRYAGASTAALAALTAMLATEAVTGYGRIVAPRLFAHGDPTLDAFEWSQLPAQLRRLGVPRPRDFVVTTNWIYAGRIDEALHHSVPIVVFGGNPKEFGLRQDPAELLDRVALVIGPADTMQGMAQRLQPYFLSVQPIASLALGRSGLPEIPLTLLRAKRLLRPMPGATGSGEGPW